MSASRGWTAQADDDLIHLADSGFQLESMAWALNRSPGTIRVRLTELGWTPSSAESGPRQVPSEARSGAPPAHPQVGARKLLGF